MDGPQNPLGPGAEIATYRVQSLIARSGLGVVYRAFDPRRGRPVALLLLAPGLSSHEEFGRRFIRESRLAGSLDHPNILPLYQVGEWSGLLYAAMHYVRGTDLQAELDRRGTLPLPEALRILADTAAALDAAHAAGVVHADVRPGNVLLAEDGRAAGGNGGRHVYLTGFGLAPGRSATGPAAPAPLPGPVDYLAPEQVRGEDVDARADVYALGCVAYALLAGHPPFDHGDDAARSRAHPAGEPPRPSGERPDVPAAVDDAILRALAEDRQDRPSSCGALVDLMTAVAATGDAPLRSASATELDGTPPAGGVPGEDGAGGVQGAPGRPADEAGPPEADPRAGRHQGSRHRVAPRGRGRTRQAVVAGAVLLVLIAVGLVLMRLLPGERPMTFRADGVPYTLEVPGDWTARTHQAGDSTVSVLSAADLTAFFSDDPDAAAAVGRAVAEDPASVVGLAIYHRPAGLEGQSTAARIDAAEALLPGREAYLVPRGKTTAGDLEGEAMEGSMQLPDATLQVRVVVVEADPSQLLVFFAPSSLFQEQDQVFDEVAGSLHRTGPPPGSGGH